ncbi:uncharacterized protein LOC126998691 [Eriocheir sinensis]|uniref:uncharacterized protein LOC126998691 n=1 Tax=Eriocheir sinensis TaxID=95602 RepID=UPI0021CA04A3|nr:uncharacterized protein LOC126998691 [Eriocheir sinensis]
MSAHNQGTLVTSLLCNSAWGSVVNEARLDLFARKQIPYEAIPPTRAALLQHTKRSAYQAGCKITSPYGLADLIFYVFRAACNVLSVLCVQSQYSTWREDAANTHRLKRLQHLHLNNTGKTYSTTGGGGGGGGGSDLPMAYQNPAFLGGQEPTPAPLPPRPLLTRSLSRASSLGWTAEMTQTHPPASTASLQMQIQPLQVRTGLPGWDPYLNRESTSEFNAATFSPASVGFMPLVAGGGGGGGGGPSSATARNSLAHYTTPTSSSSSPPSPTSSPYTIYHHNPPHLLYPLPLAPLGPPSINGGLDSFSYAAGTQSLDRRRYVRRWQGVGGGGGGGGGGVVGGASSKSSLGGESDDLRRYRDVAL